MCNLDEGIWEDTLEDAYEYGVEKGIEHMHNAALSTEKI